MEVEKLLKEMKKYAESQGFRLNPDPNVVITIAKGLIENEKKYGHRYCPCRTIAGDRGEDALKICPCEWHRAEIEEGGRCLCGLFVKK